MKKHYSKLRILADKVRSNLVRLAFPEYHSKIELECSNVSPNNKLVNSHFYSLEHKVSPNNKIVNSYLYPEILKNLNSKSD